MLRPVHLMFMLLPGTTVLPQHAPWAEDARLATRDRLLSIASEAVTEPPGNFHLPERVDLRPFLPPPGDQGRQHSSIAWALAYGLKSFQENLQREVGTLDSVGLAIRGTSSVLHSPTTSPGTGPIPPTPCVRGAISRRSSPSWWNRDAVPGTVSPTTRPDGAVPGRSPIHSCRSPVPM